MTLAVDQASVIAVMEDLAQAYVTIHAFVADSIVATPGEPDPWHSIKTFSRSAGGYIFNAMGALGCVADLLGKVS